MMTDHVIAYIGNCLNSYKPNKPVKPRYLPTAVFNHTEDYGELYTQYSTYDLFLNIMYSSSNG